MTDKLQTVLECSDRLGSASSGFAIARAPIPNAPDWVSRSAHSTRNPTTLRFDGWGSSAKSRQPAPPIDRSSVIVSTGRELTEFVVASSGDIVGGRAIVKKF